MGGAERARAGTRLFPNGWRFVQARGKSPLIPKLPDVPTAVRPATWFHPPLYMAEQSKEKSDDQCKKFLRENPDVLTMEPRDDTAWGRLAYLHICEGSQPSREDIAKYCAQLGRKGQTMNNISDGDRQKLMRGLKNAGIEILQLFMRDPKHKESTDVLRKIFKSYVDIVPDEKEARHDAIREAIRELESLYTELKTFDPREMELVLSAPSEDVEIRLGLVKKLRAIFDRYDIDREKRKPILEKVKQEVKSTEETIEGTETVEEEKKPIEFIKTKCRKYGFNNTSLVKQFHEKKILMETMVICDVVKRGKRIPDDDNFLRIFVSKGKGHIGDMLSPFNVLVDRSVVPYDMETVPLELWWQSAKIKMRESDSQFEARRFQIYKKGEPKRRYFDIKSEGIRGTRFDQPFISRTHTDPVIYNYIDSRYFYCKAYQHYVRNNIAFLLLRDLHRYGLNLLLVGPDGYPMRDPNRDYLDESVPFGHERVLVCMLLGLEPWEQYRKKHSIYYPDWIVKLGGEP